MEHQESISQSPGISPSAPGYANGLPWSLQTRTWADVGISLPYGATGEIRTQCPQCHPESTQKSLQVHVQKAIWYCYYCGWKGALRRARNPSTVRSHRPRATTLPPEDHAVIKDLETLWTAARPLQAKDPVVSYLVQRDVLLPDGPYPDTLRYHPHLPYRHGDGTRMTYPSMLGYVQRSDGSGVGIHRTYLTTEGTKALVATPKKMTRVVAKGALMGSAIRLAPAGSVLGVAEGIETALSVQTYAGESCWACLSAAGLARVVIPREVEEVHIWGDHDSPGIRAAEALARRLLPFHHIKILIPETLGADWADREEA